MGIFDQLGFTNIDLTDDPDEIMSIDNLAMTVVPVRIKDPANNQRLTNRIARPMNIRFAGVVNRRYGEMNWENTDPDLDGIVPTNSMVLSDQTAQDHAMVEPGVIEKKSNKTYDNCCCVQASQCGYLSGDDSKHHYDILPHDLRKVLLNQELRHEKEFGKLWPYIETWLKGIPGARGGGGHLEYFFKPYAKELEEFAAEFEPAQDQIGAIILFGGKIVGIEVMPTVEHWLWYWKWLIRGCYGAEYIKMRETGKIVRPELKIPEQISKITNDIDNVVKELNEWIGSYKDQIAHKLLTIKSRTTKEGYNLTDKTSHKIIQLPNGGGGDMLFSGEQPMYLSLVV